MQAGSRQAPLKSSYQAIYHGISKKIDAHTEKNLPSPKNTKAEVGGHFPRWPPPFRKSMRLFKSAIYQRILMKICTQAKNYTPSLKTQKRKESVVSILKDGCCFGMQ
jgi:hypothetical protein